MISFNRRSFIAASAGSIGTLAIPSASLAQIEDPEGLPKFLDLGMNHMDRIAKTVWIARLAPGVWLHTTTAITPAGFYFPANGLIFESPDGSLLIDTGSNADHATTLLDWSKKDLKRPISLAVATHFHNDRTGGIPGLKANGITTLANPLTCELARTHGLSVPEPFPSFEGGTYKVGSDCEFFFPGAGHAKDNIVAWLPQQAVLFGGCFLKCATDGGLGNLADAVVSDWTGSIRKVQERYPSPKFVIPGHGTIAGDPIGSTLALLAKQAAPGR